MKAFISFVVLAVLLLLGPSCTKDARFQSRGQITGVDYSMCACCGGYYITIDNVQYRFDTLPSGSGIDAETDQKPIRVLVNWHKDPKACMQDLIVIDAIKREP